MSARVWRAGPMSAACAALLSWVPWAAGCAPQGSVRYERLERPPAAGRLSSDQREVLSRRGPPHSVWSGWMRTTIWVYCEGERMRHFAEFDALGRTLGVGRARRDVPGACMGPEGTRPGQTLRGRVQAAEAAEER